MKDLRTACCYFPTTVILIDDNRKYLINLKSELDIKNALYVTYDNATEALNFLRDKYQSNSFTKRCLLRPEEQKRDHRNLDIDISAIHQEVYNSTRFNEISVIVIDYAMPGMNGLEFCRQLQGHHFKIILLTGEADERLATQAFNNGLIHKFIRKDDARLHEILPLAIHELQQQYFKDLSEIVINSLTKNPEYPPCCLDDPIFTEFFDKFNRQHKVMEYYLLEATGSYLFLDEKAKPSLLIIKDEEDMEAICCDAEMSDAEVPAGVYEALKSRKMLLHRYTNDDYLKTPLEWKSLMSATKQLQGRTTYYYAYFDDLKSYPVDVKKIFSYKAYLEQHGK